MTLTKITLNSSNILNDLIIHPVGTRLFIRPLEDLRHSKVRRINDTTCRIEAWYNTNKLVLLVDESKQPSEIVVEAVELDSLRGCTWNVYLGRQLILEDIGRLKLKQRIPVRPFPIKPPKANIPHITGKKVVALITTFNGLKWTQKCVESIRNLKTSHEVSLVISDNCSTDGSLEWFTQEGIPCYTLFGRRSVGAGLNLGLTEALKLKPDYLLIMNNDVILPEDYLDTLVDHYENKKGDGCLFISGYITNMNYSHPDPVRAKTLGTTDDMKDFMDTGDFSCFLITPETLNRAGFFDENYDPRYLEDNDFLHAIYMAGGKAFRTGQTSFYHDWGTTMTLHPEEKKKWIPTFRKNLLYYLQKWGDFPRGAERHAPTLDLTKGHPCNGGGTKPKKVKTYERDQVALIQMGHIGDIIATLPIAKEIHDNDEKVVWLANQRFKPLLETINYIEEVVPFSDDVNDSETYFGRKFREAQAWAEKEQFRRTIIAQITPIHTKEFYTSSYVHNKFHYILCLGRMPKILKPDMPIVPYSFDKKAKFTVGLMLVSHSLPIHWGRYEMLDSVLHTVSENLDVEYVNLSLEAYGGKVPVRDLGRNIAIHQLSGAIDALDLLLTVDTGGYYPGLVTDTPMIHVLPKPRFADDPKAPPKYSCEEQGFSTFCEIIDYWFAGNLADLDKLIVKRLNEGSDLRNVKKGYLGLKREWANL